MMINETQIPPCGFSCKTLKDYILYSLAVTESKITLEIILKCYTVIPAAP